MLNIFRTLWYDKNKTFGLEFQETKPSGLIERFNGVKLRPQSYLDGNTNEIAKLEEGSFYRIKSSLFLFSAFTRA